VNAPKGGFFSTIPSGRAYNQSFQTSIRWNAYILRAMARRHGHDICDVMAAPATSPMRCMALREVGRDLADGLIYAFHAAAGSQFHDGNKTHRS